MIHARSLHTAQKVTTYVWAEDESAAGMQLLWQYRQNKQDLLKAAVADGCALRLHLLIMFVSVKLGLLKVQPRLCSIKVTVLLHNLISPCLVPAAHLTSQMQVVQHVLAEDARNMGLVLLPVFSHKEWALRRGGADNEGAGEDRMQPRPLLLCDLCRQNRLLAASIFVL